MTTSGCRQVRDQAVRNHDGLVREASHLLVSGVVGALGCVGSARPAHLDLRAVDEADVVILRAAAVVDGARLERSEPLEYVLAKRCNEMRLVIVQRCDYIPSYLPHDLTALAELQVEAYPAERERWTTEEDACRFDVVAVVPVAARGAFQYV